ncbi:hypothetical protein I6A84_44225 [Frankia sp. CNm7]|uniref:Uncharacterized protein n=1 Tax=Frankia nepalensis TaxID=1836974 RepID=A0A937RNX7_9ACTN|nr:hypothetical protein [Frankia nepalensis]MBL7496817.1 hypothetical protein [Frankia nepalensis]MBL7510972.1 hypothetical protein [Frankia nepalensis]MBL7524863.1 hypothetical protein [Frankia nepalensis]MBL7633635.1 hypothetical protein [Frankia nepalensis]
MTPTAATPPRAPGSPGRRPRRGRTVALVVTAAVLAAAAITGLATVTFSSGGEAPAPATVAAPTPTGPGQPGSPNLTTEQRDLVSRFDPAQLRACEPNPEPAGAGITAAVFCQTADGRTIAAYGYGDRGALRDDVATRVGGITEGGRCERGGSEVFQWDTGAGSRPGGTVICHPRDGYQFLFWSMDANEVAFLAYDRDPRALYDWWTDFQPFPGGDGPSAPPRAA